MLESTLTINLVKEVYLRVSIRRNHRNYLCFVFQVLGVGEHGDRLMEVMTIGREPKTPQASMEIPHGWQRKQQ